MGLHDDIKAGILEQTSKSTKNGRGKPDDEPKASNSPLAMMIEQQLNKLFYLPPKYKEELQMLKHQYMQEDEERVGLHCSAILAPESDFCYREQVLSLFYKQLQGENIPIQRKRVFEEGKSIGTKWQRLFIRGGIGVKEDMDVSRFVKKYDLSYTPDGIVTLFGKRIVAEVKSQNTFTYKKQKSHPSGIKQLKMYMYFENADYGFVLVEDKNDQNFKVLLVDELDIAELEPYIERLEMIQQYKQEFLQDRKMVARHKSCTSATCKMAKECNMRDACWNTGMGRVRI